MNDDYLWDGSGEPDPEVQRLERVLGKYRYQPKPLNPALTSRFSWKSRPWVRLAAAAAAILIVLGVVFIFKLQNKNVSQSELRAKDQSTDQQTAPPKPVPNSPPERKDNVAVTHNSPHKIYRRPPAQKPTESPTVAASSFVAERQPIIIPFIDAGTARHLEQAQLMLRSFRNTRDSESGPDTDVLYERQRSRGLLNKNIILRRDAEAKGNLPAEDLLSTLEPFLLDIANLPDRPSGDELRSIKERMQKKEIVSALQIYSAPTLSQVF